MSDFDMTNITTDPNNPDFEGMEETDVVRPTVVTIDDEEEKQNQVDHLCSEFRQAWAEKQPRIQKLTKWRKQIAGESLIPKKDWPIVNASNVAVPLTKTLNNTVYGYLKQTFSAREPFWNVKPLRDNDKDRKMFKVVGKYMNMLAESPYDMNINAKNKTILKTAGGTGTCFTKVVWSRKQWKFKYYDEDMGDFREVERVVHRGPALIPIPEEDVYYRSAWESIEELPWIAHEVHLPRHEVESRAAQGIYKQEAIDEILKWARSDIRQTEQTDLDIRYMDRLNEDIWDLAEFHFFYDVDGDGNWTDLVYTIHVPSGTLVREGYNEFGERMYQPIVFDHKPFQIEGEGVAEMAEGMQDEVNQVHNLRNDNMKVANTVMLAIRTGTGYGPTEPLYTGKIWTLPEPTQDIQPIRLGEVYPSSLQAEQQSVNYAQRVTGMSDIMAGFASQTLGTRDTAQGQQMRAARATGIFNSIVEAAADSYSRIGLLTFYQLVRHKREVIESERKIQRLTNEEIELLNEALDINMEELPTRVRLSIRMTDVEQTFEAKRQNYLSLFQLYSGFIKQQTPIAQQLFSPQGQQIAQQAPELYKYLLRVYVGGAKLMDQIFKFFGVDEESDYIPETKRQEALIDFINVMQDNMSEARNLPNGPAMGMTEQERQMMEEPNVGPQVSGNERGRTGGATGQGAGARATGPGAFPGLSGE
jgi:hypothetical protein